MIEVLKPRLLTTIQDLGRMGYQQYGMVAGGAVDTYALKIANALMGNSLSEAGLEITMSGPVMKAFQDMYISITGADLNPHIDGVKIPMWASIGWQKGSVLDFRGVACGLRAYLAVLGGFEVPMMMGSRSTYIPAHIGGVEGRALQQGDILRGRSEEFCRYRRRLAPKYIPSYPGTKTIRVILGPHSHYFSRKGSDAFLTSSYTVTNQLNRMGMKLSGEKIEHKEKADIPSQAVTFGTIQVAADGQPMVLLADRQTTGGYTQIATVITVDQYLLAQSKPGDVVYFQEVSLDEAQQLLKEREGFLKQLAPGAV